ncbi:MAG TPA: adenylosuccinate lyase [Dehalococcoidia bacterium]|nr:adenylosuccinate lyase [Dehalococcoidia bacterium]
MIERYSRPEMARIWSEETKFQKWLDVELAIVDAWAEKGVVPREDAEAIRRKARFDIDAIWRYWKTTQHDVTAFLRSVADSLGPEGRWVHLGATSSDVWDTATALQLREAAELLERDLAALRETLERRAVEFKDTLCIGRTHGVHAEPTTFGLKLAGWVSEVRRQQRRLADAKAEVAVGKLSGAVGTHATMPPDVEETALRSLGLAVEPISTQVVPRDRHAAFVATLALIGASLERFATEIRHLQRTEVLEAEEPFGEGQTGSSAMPHKRNPEKCERICGLARVLRGYTLTAYENVALWHERDISHSSAERIVLPDACLALDYMLALFTDVVAGLQVYPERMRENLELTQGLVFSQRVLLALVEKGMSRTDAYAVVQRNAMRAWKERTPFRGLLERDPEVASRLTARDLDELFDYGYFVRYVDDAFARLGLG